MLPLLDMLGELKITIRCEQIAIDTLLQNRRMKNVITVDCLVSHFIHTSHDNAREVQQFTCF